MTDFIEQFKSLTPKQSLFPTLSRGHRLELTVAALSDRISWNNLTADPASPQPPSTVEDWFSAVYRIEQRLEELFSKDGVTRSDIEGRFILASGYLHEITKKSVPLASLMGESPFLIPDGIDGNMSDSVDCPMLLAQLGFWFIKNYPSFGGEEDITAWWDKTESEALKAGFTKEDASLVRAVQREAPNHSWPLDLWFVVGLLHPDRGSFLKRLAKREGWREHFLVLLEHDGPYDVGLYT